MGTRWTAKSVVQEADISSADGNADLQHHNQDSPHFAQQAVLARRSTAAEVRWQTILVFL